MVVAPDDSPAPFAGCPSSYTRRENKCFTLYTRPLAKSSCAADGAELFNIRSREDNGWLVQRIRRHMRDDVSSACAAVTMKTDNYYDIRLDG
ncbi:uncharacterized protein LOC118403432 isoform X2 [Branchiostoma floridae]|nr:uncharacterized protein LOC118403432 isoform X2 [Branchiostoma floridae]